MPIYFDELEKIILKWIRINQLKKPTKEAASWFVYKHLMQSSKKDMITNIIKVFESITIEDVKWNISNSVKKDNYINIKSSIKRSLL